MESTNSGMRDLHLDIQLGLNETFGLSPQALSASSTISSSDYSPFTPTSGRSTPPRCNSMDFSNSFDSYSSMSSYDFTPPSSAVSTSLSLDSSFGGDEYELSLYNFPATPTRTRANPDFGGMSFGCGSGLQTTPSHAMPHGHTFPEDMFASSFSQAFGCDNNLETSAMWVQPDSPVNFMPTPQKAPLRPLSDDGNLKRMSLALQREQSRSPRKGPVPRSKAKKVTVKRYGYHNGTTSIECVVIPKAARYFCEWPGCERNYQRKEHMKRHMDSIHLNIKTEECQWCDHGSNRGDNFKTHLEKHLRAESKSPRVKVVTDPVERAKIDQVLAEISSRPRKAVKSAPKRAGSKCKP
ncbi:hypothetical protein QBC37DRAFT_139557 [Rhypophila decipiens]|uniref:C2H2-type domain-containing protein n=1 Tax=Rhypophila decipiens TaxID=261697 RepID=A0AAN7B942_9PEZI|nr:hypothetical protein QBC37DRAFT_139557 [Rhypophila decipiens]